MTERNTTIRDNLRRTIARGHPPCAICGNEIDYALHYPDPGAYVVDHIVPIALGGPNTLANGQAAHARCNRAKSDKLLAPIMKRCGSLIIPGGGTPPGR